MVVVGGAGVEAAEVDPGVLGAADDDADDAAALDAAGLETAGVEAAGLDAAELAGTGAAASSKRTSPCTGCPSAETTR